MTREQYLKNLEVPQGKIDVVLDTDAYNEIDDQFAICYLVGSPEKADVKGICAAPFLNRRSASPADGMEKSYGEILKVLTLAQREDLHPVVYRGSEQYLTDEQTPVESPAARFMAELADRYSPEKPLYILALGAITNVASAILLNPRMTENCVVVWLGGNGIHVEPGCAEFNMVQDIAAARVLFGCGVPLVQLPAIGVVDRFMISGVELEYWLKGKNPVCDYLYRNTVEEAQTYVRKDRPWCRIIWDVTAVGWILNEGERFMRCKRIPSPIPQYDQSYRFDESRHPICYVHAIHRDELFGDLLRVLRGW